MVAILLCGTKDFVSQKNFLYLIIASLILSQITSKRSTLQLFKRKYEASSCHFYARQKKVQFLAKKTSGKRRTSL